jgi:phosphoadenosine phosphosulfate reductase
MTNKTSAKILPMLDSSHIEKYALIEDPGQLLAELYREFGDRMAIATSGQPTDTAIMALAVKAGVQKPRVYTTDTYRLFPETYVYFETLEKFFHLTIERFTPPEKDLLRMVEQHGEFLFYDSKDKQEYCCHVRKVLPNLKALETLDVWVTGLRRDQSAERAKLPRLEIIQHKTADGTTRPILKVNPLAAWTEAQVTDYLQANHIPNHPLFEKKLPGGWSYESLGCILCTTPIGPHEPRRAGRWRWFNSVDDKKECGLHLPVKKSL